MYLLAAPHLKIRGLPLSKSFESVEAHLRLDESSLLTRIEDSTSEKMKPAQEIIDRIWRRDFYKKLLRIDMKNCPAEIRGMDARGVLEDFLSTSNVSDTLKKDFTAFRTKIVTGMTGKQVI